MKGWKCTRRSDRDLVNGCGEAEMGVGVGSIGLVEGRMCNVAVETW